MAKIENAKPKNSSGGYSRLVHDPQMADIFTKAQSTVITNGTELEKIISSQAKVINNLDAFIKDVTASKDGSMNGTYLCVKKIVKNSKYKMDNHEPDFIVFIVAEDRICDIIELKDGDSFDTKKSTSEYESLKAFTNHLAPQIPFRVKYYICCFNQCDKSKIISGFKNRFTEDQVMTGREFCELLGINYDNIVNSREQDAIDNFNYVVHELTKISAIRHAVKEDTLKHISENDFYEPYGL